MKSKARSNTKWTHFLFKTQTHLSSNPQSQISRVTDVLLSWIFFFLNLRLKCRACLYRSNFKQHQRLDPSGTTPRVTNTPLKCSTKPCFTSAYKLLQQIVKLCIWILTTLQNSQAVSQYQSSLICRLLGHRTMSKS